MLATKWKIYKRKNITKLSAFILTIFFLLIAISSALNIYLKVKYYESIAVKSYMDSDTLHNNLKDAAERLEFVIRVYKNEEYILSGGTVKNLNIEDNWQLTNLYNNYIAENHYKDNSEIRELFFKEKHQEIQNIKENIIDTDLANYNMIMGELNSSQGFIYYITDGVDEVTNTGNPKKDFYMNRNAYIVLDNEDTELFPTSGDSVITDLSFEEGISQNTKIYAAIEDESLLKRTNKWNTDRKILMKNTAVIIVCLIIIAANLSYLIYVTGKTPENEEIKLTHFDKLFTDLNLLAVLGIIYMCKLEYFNVLNIRYQNENLMKLYVLILSAIISSLILILLLSLIRHIKNETIIKNSAIYKIVSKSVTTLFNIISSGPLMYKIMGSVILLIAASAYSKKVPYATAAILIISLYLVYHKVLQFQKISEGINTVKNGDYDFKIELAGNGEFKKLSNDINEIISGLKTAVQNEVKSERLKTELITNVSHDIKTPLTSIISYVDLLKREGLNSNNAPKYLDILERKSNRLKILTEDLFEAAKASSGNIKPKFEKVNVNSLIEQVLGELDEKIIESKLIIKVSAQRDKIYAKADGRLLSRVMENLLSNIFKYALNESRVYIEITESENIVSVSFKNISATELNIPIDELMERFKRGDESRTSEGSGLGLSIAKSLMEVQEGELEISIDGDLFKAEIRLKKF